MKTQVIIIFFVLSLNLKAQFRTEPFARYCKNLPSDINAVCRSKTGYVMMTTNSGVYTYDGYSAVLDINLKVQKYFAIYEIKKNVFIILAENSILLYNKNTGNFKEKSLTYLEKNASSFFYNQIIKLNGQFGIIWRGYAFICKFENESIEIISNYPKSNYTYCFKQDQFKTYLLNIDTSIHEKIQEVFEHKYLNKHPLYLTYFQNGFKIPDQIINQMPVNQMVLFEYHFGKYLPKSLKSIFFDKMLWKDSSDVLLFPNKEYLQFIYKDEMGFVWIKSSTSLLVYFEVPCTVKEVLNGLYISQLINLNESETLIATADQLLLCDKKYNILKSFNVRVVDFIRFNKDSVFCISDNEIQQWYNIKTK